MSERSASLVALLVLAGGCGPPDPGDAGPGDAGPGDTGPAVMPAPAEAPGVVAPLADPADPGQPGQPADPADPAVVADAGPLEVRVTGDDYRWLLRYPGPDGRLDTPDDVLRERHLHLPARREVILDLASNDYVYTFYVPYLDILEVAVPDVPFEYDLDTGPAGVHDLLGSQMCGYTHPELLGDVVIQDAAEFAAWLSARGD